MKSACAMSRLPASLGCGAFAYVFVVGSSHPLLWCPAGRGEIRTRAREKESERERARDSESSTHVFWACMFKLQHNYSAGLLKCFLLVNSSEI